MKENILNLFSLPLSWCKRLRDRRQQWSGPFTSRLPSEEITLPSASAWPIPPLTWKSKIISLYLVGYLYAPRRDSRLTLAHPCKATHLCCIFWSQGATKYFIPCILKRHWVANLHICKEKYPGDGNKEKASSLPPALSSFLLSSLPKIKWHFALFPQKCARTGLVLVVCFGYIWEFFFICLPVVGLPVITPGL